MHFLVPDPDGNLPTPNNPRAVDYFYRMYVLPVATPTKTTNPKSNIFYICTVYVVATFPFSS